MSLINSLTNSNKPNYHKLQSDVSEDLYHLHKGNKISQNKQDRSKSSNNNTKKELLEKFNVINLKR
jgi:hypothetical protein